MIKYLGSKRTLLPSLVQLLAGFPELTSVADLFCGTSRVGHAFKRAGLRVVSNDHNAYAHCLATCYVAADLEKVARDAELLLSEFRRRSGRPGYFTQTYCVDARFFQPRNGERIDAIRDAIEQKALPSPLREVVLTSLMEAADRVDSTCGLQMAYVKSWAKRSYNDLELRMPAVLPAARHGRCEALQRDANELATDLDVDVTYLDPPYNQHSYLSNYHIWESLVLWDKPAVYGIARKRIDCRSRKSRYNARSEHRATFDDLISKLRSPLIVVSFNNEGYQSRSDLEQTLGRQGEVFVVTKDFRRYVGARIGIYNPDGDKVGQVSHVRNEEYLYLLARPALVERVPDALPRLAKLAAQVDDAPDSIARVREAAVDRVAVVTHALRQGARTRPELQASTGLSEYQTRTALEHLFRRGLVRKEGPVRAPRYHWSGEVPATDGAPLGGAKDGSPVVH